MTATSEPLTAGSWSDDLHPRGRDGTFIKKFGLVKLVGASIRNQNTGKKVDLTGQRGEVISISPNPAKPGNPNILVQLRGPSGKPGPRVQVTPNMVVQAQDKGRLPGHDNFDGKPKKSKLPGWPKKNDNFEEDDDDFGPSMTEKYWRKPGGGASKFPTPPPETPEQKERRLAGEEVRGATDEELERQRNLGPEVWQQAVAKEQAARAARRAGEEQRRQDLINSINEQAADLSTTDAEERAVGLDKILSKLRFSIIDTDTLYDHVYPPNEGSSYTAERTAQHEQMWDDLLSQIEAAGIPKDHDALVLGGLPGAGKTYMLRPGQKADKFGVVSWEPGQAMPDGVTHVSVSPDNVKEMMIANGMLPPGISQDLKPMEQVTFLHQESAYVSELFTQRLSDLGYNIVLDRTMDSEGGVLRLMAPLARRGYTFRGIFADIPIEESKESAKRRYLDTALTPMGGRFIPSSVQGNRKSMKGSTSKNRDAMDALVAQDWFTQWMIVDNTGVVDKTPRGDIVGEGTGPGSAAARYLPGAEPAPVGGRLPTPTAPEPGPAPTAPPAAV